MYDSGMDTTNKYGNVDDEHKKTEAYGANGRERERAKERVSFECG